MSSCSWRIPLRGRLLLLGLTLLAGGCGGDPDPLVPEAPRMDFSFNHSGCAPPCPVTSYNIYLVQREGIPCVLAEKAGAPGEEAVLAGVKLEEGASIMITVLAYCQEDPCVRCTALKEVTIQDGRTVSLEMMTMPWCYKSPLPRQCR